MKKEIKQKVYEKYGGLCAYTGKPLGDDWQVDHMTSKVLHELHTAWNCGGCPTKYKELKKEVDNIENLFPALPIVNHYKRAFDLELFRDRMMGFHKRLAKLPKNPKVKKSIKKKEYMQKVASAFDITPEKPFCGQFYFEQIPYV